MNREKCLDSPKKRNEYEKEDTGKNEYKKRTRKEGI